MFLIWCKIICVIKIITDNILTVESCFLKIREIPPLSLPVFLFNAMVQFACLRKIASFENRLFAFFDVIPPRVEVRASVCLAASALCGSLCSRIEHTLSSGFYFTFYPPFLFRQSRESTRCFLVIEVVSRYSKNFPRRKTKHIFFSHISK